MQLSTEPVALARDLFTAPVKVTASWPSLMLRVLFCGACYDGEMLIRPATVRDIPAIAGLIGTFAQRGLMLFRSHAELYEAVRDFIVAEEETEVVGVGALEIVWGDLAEVRSLAVSPRGRATGSAKRWCRRWWRRRGGWRFGVCLR